MLKKMDRKSLSILCFAMGLYSFSVQAGTVLNYVVNEDNSEMETMFYLGDNAVKFDTLHNGRKDTVIFDKNQKVVWFVDHKTKTYMEMNEAFVQTQISPAMQMMEAQMANMPPEAQQMMKKMMKEKTGNDHFRPPSTSNQSAKKPIVFKKVASKVPVGEWKTTHFQGTKNNKLVTEVWTVDPKNLKLKQSSFSIMSDFGTFMEDLLEPLLKLATMDNPSEGWNVKEWEDVFKGIPVKSVNYGSKKQTMNLRKAYTEAFSKNFFQPPVGYTNQGAK